ncbi:MAG: peptidoglycan DD-metalloendopeptidase family protein [Planctomycetota bacterium]
MFRLAGALLLLAGAAWSQWGRDINAGMGPQLLRSVEDDLAAIVHAPPAERPRLIEACVARHGVERIEALKRYRNPELKPLFFALLDHDDWRVRHRALLVLEYYGDRAVLAKAWLLLTHPQRRLREKAAITCLKLWDDRPPPGDLDRLVAQERDLHVRRCLEALQRRVAGKLEVTRVHQEYVRTARNGLRLTPFLGGMDQLSRAAPGYRRKTNARTGRRGGRTPPADRWTTPLLGFGEEEVEGVSLQPFANLRQNGRVYHTGLDVGAALDGAGFYAAAAGVVRLVHTGSDMGTLIVVEHQLRGGERVNAIYMHGGDTVFVAAGDEVRSGQLLTTMGLGFSVENGGHFAHLHYGLYPGRFDMRHNYGYKLVQDGLRDWYDPAKFLPQWIERTRALLPALRPLEPPLARAVRQIERGEHGRAYLDALKVRNAAEPGSEVHVDAVYLLGVLEQVPQNALKRATKARQDGYPQAARQELKSLSLRCAGIRGAESLKQTLDGWDAEPLFQKALRGEDRIEATLKRADKLKDPAKARALWEKLLEKYGDTCLKPRIEDQIR